MSQIDVVSVLQEKWTQTWQVLHIEPDTSLFDNLCKQYNQAHRAYHNLIHIQACFEQFDSVRSLAEQPIEIELAIWFHDVIYKPRRTDNEAASAAYARDVLDSAGVPKKTVDQVEGLILLTQHTAVPSTSDGALLIDIDLSILGATVERFDEYEHQIRREYGWVPWFLFRKRRALLLEQFLARPAIFTTPIFHQNLEAQARSNLHRSIAQLRP